MVGTVYGRYDFAAANRLASTIACLFRVIFLPFLLLALNILVIMLVHISHLLSWILLPLY